MEILPGIEIIDLALYLKNEQILIISDFHLGYEELLEQKGILTPRLQLNDIINQLKKILKEVKPKKIIINGDLKHEYGKIINQEWRDTTRLFNFLEQHCQEITIVKGNHDLFLGPLARKNNITIVNDFKVKDILIAHGNELIGTNAKTIIIGHEHPAVSLKEGSKMEKYKCFIKGKWKRKNLIVLPSINPLTCGSDIHSTRRFSPFLKDISNFDVFVVNNGEVFEFGKVEMI